MLKNYLLMAFRKLKKQKGYALINVAGLAIGMACCILILSFVLTELSFDRYHDNANRIYRLIANLTLGNTPNMIATSNPMSSVSMREEFTEVRAVTRVFPFRRAPLKYGDVEFYEERIFYADASIFDVFTFPMIKGDPKTALTTANSLVLTEDTAAKYFGKQDPIGKILKINDQYDCKVTGVVRNVPQNSHFTFDMLLSLETFIQLNKPMFESWMGPFGFHAYLLLEENVDYKALEKKFPALIEKHAGESLRSYGAALDFYLQPLTKTHLYSDYRHEISVQGDIKYVYVFGFIAVFVLLIACFNFMNIGTARSLTRAREVGMRKVLGADKGNLIRQFLGESLFYSFISLALAVILAHLALPVFRTLSGRPLSIDYTAIPWLIPGFIGLAFIVGMFAGSYPALFLASFHPAKVLKDILRPGSGSYRFRQVLVLLQFVISITLIICTLVVFKQLLFMKNKNLGFDKEHVVVIPIMDNTIRQSIEAIKTDLRKHPGIISVAAGSHEPGGRPSGGSYQPEA
ncbi:MAG: ABC transporter permease [Candidatus Aminicenantes bacterium]|nr:ABC transporter permease [Candidatus Aminicenantes bacterium]